MRKRILLLIGLLTVIILLLLADLKEILELLSRVNPLVIVFGCLLQLITISLVAIQWQQIALQFQEKIPFLKMVKINLMGTFVESITPAVKTGGEALKVYLLKKEFAMSLSKATFIVSIQKLFSLSTFLLLNIISLALLVLVMGVEQLPINIIVPGILFLVTFIMVLVVFVFYSQWSQKIIHKLPVPVKWKNATDTLVMEFTNNLRNFSHNSKGKGYIFLLSLFIWFLFAFKAYYIAYGLQVPIGFWPIAFITFVAYMIGMVPLLPGGLGTFEASMVFLLIPFGVSLEQALVLTLSIRFVTYWFVFILSALFLAYHNLFSKSLSRPAER